jgi:methyl-accepting chemotaxis protein
LREAGATLEYASQGKFFRRVLLRGMRGTFRHKSQLINAAIEKTAQNTASLKEVERLISQSAELTAGAADESRQASAVVKQLYEASEKIGNVVNFISSIAWKTNLLSLNAAIEAARAGSAGLGFGVVAKEVKQLAEQTASAANEITREIGQMHEEVSRTTKAIESIDQTMSKLKEISATIEQAVVDQKVKSGKTNGCVLVGRG